MTTPVKIPQLSANMEEGMVGRWMASEGDVVVQAAPLVEIVTDKATFEVEAPASGTLLRIVAKEKSLLPVGYVIGVIGEPGEAIPDVEDENARRLARGTPPSPAPAPRKVAAERKVGGGRTVVRATPKARRLAKEKGVDLGDVKAATGADLVNEEILRRYLDGLDA